MIHVKSWPNAWRGIRCSVSINREKNDVMSVMKAMTTKLTENSARHSHEQPCTSVSCSRQAGFFGAAAAGNRGMASKSGTQASFSGWGSP